MRSLNLSLVAWATLALACSDDRPSADTSETGSPTSDSSTDSSSGDGDGDPTTGDGDGDPTTGDGDGDPTTGDGDGDPTTGDGDGDPSTGECSRASECELVNDCCRCEVVVAGQPPACDVPECFAPSCEAAGYVPEPACFVGTCAPAPVSCDLNQIRCDIVEPPACEGGLIRSVEDACYGPCVPASMCETLPSECDPSTCGDGYACVVTQSGAPSRCVPLPPGCDGSPGCDCLQPWWGEVCNGGCGTTGGSLLCEDGG